MSDSRDVIGRCIEVAGVVIALVVGVGSLLLTCEQSKTASKALQQSQQSIEAQTKLEASRILHEEPRDCSKQVCPLDRPRCLQNDAGRCMPAAPLALRKTTARQVIKLIGSKSPAETDHLMHARVPWMDFRGLDASGWDFYAADFRCATLNERTNLEAAEFERTDLRGMGSFAPPKLVKRKLNQAVFIPPTVCPNGFVIQSEEESCAEHVLKGDKDVIKQLHRIWCSSQADPLELAAHTNEKQDAKSLPDVLSSEEDAAPLREFFGK